MMVRGTTFEMAVVFFDSANYFVDTQTSAGYRESDRFMKDKKQTSFLVRFYIY